MSSFKILVDTFSILIDPSSSDSSCKDLLHFFTSEGNIEVYDYIESLNDASTKKWWNGSREMTKTIAEFMFNHLDKNKIINTINSSSIHIRNELLNHILPYSDCITTKNVGIHSYILITSIFRNIKDETNNPLVITFDSLIQAQPIYTNLNSQYGPSLYQEAQGNCPKCSLPLYIESGEFSSWNYQVTKIDTSVKENTKDNLICLCKNCFRKYTLHADNYDLDDIRSAKESLSVRSKAFNKVSNVQIDTDIREIIYSLSDLDISEIDELNFDPVAVRDKLSDTPQLMIKVQAYATYYYPFINETLKELSDDDIIDIEALEGAIKHAYGNLSKTFDKSNIFNTLVDWLVAKSQKTREGCEIIISYFVQDCEVFHAISK